MSQNIKKRKRDSKGSWSDVPKKEKNFKYITKTGHIPISYVTPSSPFLPNKEEDFIKSNFNFSIQDLELTEIEEAKVIILGGDVSLCAFRGEDL